MNSFNKLPQSILDIDRGDETLFECAILSDNLVKALDSGFDEDKLVNILKKNMIVSGYEVYTKPTFEERHLSKLLTSYVNKEINEDTFNKLTSTITISLEGDGEKNLYGEIPIYDISKYIDKKGSLPLEECLNKNGIRDTVAMFSAIRERGDYPFLNYVKFTTNECDLISESVYKDDSFGNVKIEESFIDSDSFSDDVKNISSFCDEFVDAFNDKTPKDFVNYLLFGRSKIERIFSENKEYNHNYYFMDREQSIGDNLQIIGALKKIIDEDLLDKEEVDKLFRVKSYSVDECSELDSINNNSRYFSFTPSELLSLVNSLSSKEIDKDTFDKLTDTFILESGTGSYGEEKSIYGDIKIYDVEDYLANKDTKDIEDCIDIDNIVKVFDNFKNFDEYYIEYVDFEFKNDSRLINYMEAISEAVESEDRDKLKEVLSDKDLIDFYKNTDIERKPKEIGIDISRLKKAEIEDERDWTFL